MFVAIEGPDGVGKTTLVERLHAELGDLTTVVSFPSRGPVGQLIRTLVLSGQAPIDTHACLFAADRKWICHDVILPALHAGRHVIADRYQLSTLVYQCVEPFRLHQRQAFLGQMERLIALTGGEPVPDLTLVLDLDRHELSRRRRARRKTDDAFEADDLLQGAVHRLYRELAEEGEQPGYFELVSAEGSDSDVFERVRSALEKNRLWPR